MILEGISNKLFNELRDEAVKIWETYDNTYGYVDEKTTRLSELTNVKDNYGTIIGMFDIKNQEKLYNAVGEDGKRAINAWTGGLYNNIKLAKEMGMY